MPETIRTGRAAALLSVGYAVAGYLLTLGVLVYTIGFLARWGVPKNIDSAAGTPWPAAVAIDAALLLLFAVQHTVMARGAVKRRSARLFGAHAERATFVVATGAVLVTLLAAWQPLPAVLWRLTGPAAVAVYAVFAAGWLVALGPPSRSATPTCSGCGRPGGTFAAGSTNHPSSRGAACTPGSGTR